MNFGSQWLGLGRVNLQRINHCQTAFAGQLGQDGSHTGAVHLLVDLLGEVLVGHIREYATASAPQWRGSHTGTGAARSLLLERLLGRVLDLLAVFLGTCALTGIGLESDHDLVHQIFVVCATKHGLRGFVFRSSLALVIQEFELHQFAPFAVADFALTAGRTVTKPPADPGIAPLINSS